MKNMKKGFAWALVCVMLLGLIPMHIGWATEEYFYNEATATTEAVSTDTEVTQDAEAGGAEEAGTVVTGDEIVVDSVPETENTADTTSVDISTAISEASTGMALTIAETVEKTTATPAKEETKKEKKTAKVNALTAGEPVALDALGADVPMAVDEEGPQEHDLQKVQTTVKVNGEDYTPGQTVKDGSAVSIKIYGELDNDQKVSAGDKCVYDLQSIGIDFAVVSDGDVTFDGKVVGKYSITEDGKLEITFNDEFVQLSNRFVEIELDGRINLDEIDLDDNGDGKFQVENKDYTIHVDTDDTPREVSVNKRSEGSVEIDAATGKPKQKFVITVTAEEDVTDVSIKDVLNTADGKVSIQDITVTPQSAGSVSTEADGFSGTITVKKGETVTIEYWVYGDMDMYNDGSNRSVQNVVTATDRFGKETSDDAWFTVTSPSVSKSGSMDSVTGMVTWTVTVNNPDGVDLAGTKLTDVLGSSGYTEGTGTASVTVTPALSGTGSLTLGELNNFTFPSNSTASSYTFTYTVELSEEYKDSYGKTVSNHAEITSDKYPKSSVDASVNVVNDKNLVTGKTGELLNNTRAKWSVTFEIPEGLTTDRLVLTDQFDWPLTVDKDSIVIKPSGQLQYTIGDYYQGFTITFEKNGMGTYPTGTYTLEYETDIPEGTAGTYKNEAWLTIGYADGEKVGASIEITTMIEKYVDTITPGSAQEPAQISWQVHIPQEALDIIQKGGTYTIVDTLPEGLEYIEDSISIQNNRWYDGSPYSKSSVSVLGRTMTITFDSNLLAYVSGLTNPSEGLWIVFKTQIADMDAFVLGGKQEYTNEVQLNKDGKIADKASATAELGPSGILSKKYDGNYDANHTQPSYTIEVNKNRYNLSSDDFLTVEDTLPEDFELLEDTLEVMNVDTGQLITGDALGLKVNGNVFTFTIPDETYVKITYKVKINLELGTSLTKDNSTNTVTITGTTAGSDQSADMEGCTVLEGKAQAGSTNASLTIEKHYSGKRLAGAEFVIRMVDANLNAYEVGAVPGYNGEMSLVPDSTADGYYTVNNLLYDYIYELEETKAPAGYKKLDDKKYYVFLSKTSKTDAAYKNLAGKNVVYFDGTQSAYGEDDVENEPIDGMTITISKKAVNAATELPGAKLELYKDSVASGNKWTEWTSTSTAKSFTIVTTATDKDNELEPGTYVLVEKEAPAGYTYSDNITFTVDASGQITATGQEVSADKGTLTMRDKKLEIYISKRELNSSDTAELEGAKFAVREEGSAVNIETWTQGKGPHPIDPTKLEIGTGTVYELVETDAPEGYKIATDPIKFTIDKYGVVSLVGSYTNAECGKNNSATQNNMVIMYDELEDGTIRISKKEIANGPELPGATFILYKDSVSVSNKVTEWKTGSTAKVFKIKTVASATNELEPGTYVLVETVAPDGYTYAEQVTFTVDEDGNINVISGDGVSASGGKAVVMLDKAIGNVSVSKKGITGDITGEDELKGAKFVLLEVDSDGKEGKQVDGWESDGKKSHEIEGTSLKVGQKYVLRETVAPDGYEVTTDIYFEVDENGNIKLSSVNTNGDVKLDSDGRLITVYDRAKEKEEVTTTTEEKTTRRTTEKKTTEKKTTEKKTTEKKTTEKKTTEQRTTVEQQTTQVQTTATTETVTTTSKKTGDAAPIAVMVFTMLLSAAGFILLRKENRR